METAPSTPAAAVASVVDDLTPFAGESKRFEKAVKEIEKTLDPKLWVDDAHLDPKHGHKVFDRQHHAIKELMHEIKKGKSSQAALDAAQVAIDDLVDASRLLASTLLDETSGAVALDPDRQDKVDKELAKAQKELDKGDAERDKGKFDKAIKHYEKAWQYAIKAAKQAAKPPKGGRCPSAFAEQPYLDSLVARDTPEIIGGVLSLIRGSLPPSRRAHSVGVGKNRRQRGGCVEPGPREYKVFCTGTLSLRAISALAVNAVKQARSVQERESAVELIG